MKKLAFVSATALLPLFASAASLLGSTVDVRYHYQDVGLTINTLDSVLVTPGVELSCPGSPQLCGALSAPTQTVDIGDSSIRYDYVGLNGATGGFYNVAVNTFAFESLFGSGTALTGVQITTNIAGLDASRLSFAAHSLQLDMRGLNVDAVAFFRLDLQATPVPEPASAALLIGGLALLGAARRRR